MGLYYDEPDYDEIVEEEAEVDLECDEEYEALVQVLEGTAE